jgi:hypothetical protein
MDGTVVPHDKQDNRTKDSSLLLLSIITNPSDEEAIPLDQ